MNGLLKEVTVAWTWRLKSPFHAGSGLSNLAVADRLVQRNARGTPEIFGDLVKGALRMSAEQVAAWLLNAPRAYSAGRPSEPSDPVLAAIFGGGANAHFTGEFLPGARTETVAATAIDPETGAAKTNSLRRTEFVAKGAELRCSTTVWVSDSLADSARTMIVAAVAATEQIGGKGGIGWGRVKPTMCSSGISAPSASELTTLKQALTLPSDVTPAGLPKVRRPRLPSVAATAGKPQWHRLEITLKDSACFPVLPETSNHQATSASIPASTLRGALFAAWSLKQGDAWKAALSNMSEDTRWTPAYPLADGQVWYPSPRCLRQPRSGGEITNALVVAEDEQEASNPVKMKAADGWVTADGRFITIPLVTHTRMHVARDYDSGSKQRGALYSRAELAAGSKFAAWVHVDPSAFEGVETLLLGRRTSVGGGAMLAVTETGKEPQWPDLPDEAVKELKTVTVQLLSAALVRNGRGYPMLGLDKAYWTTLCGQACSVELARQTQTRRGGWMAQWGHQRTPSLMINSGSVWQLHFEDAASAIAARATLKALRFIGTGAHEGFGLLAVDPPWAMQRSLKAWKLPPVSREPLNETGKAAIATAARALPVTKNDEAARKPLQQLAVWMRNVNDAQGVREVVARCAALSSRDREYAWKMLAAGQPIRRFLDDYWNVDSPDGALVRFAIDALLIRLPLREGLR